jgi:2-hydroxy-3-keto-5-methylthiopentenyl-1-phosphate phosphatase
MRAITPTVFLDFDGTITIQDATDAILDAYADPDWMRIEDAWKAGRIGSRECLTAQMALVTATREEVDALLDGVEVDAGFVALLELCAAFSAPVHIVSDGFDYCIQRILNRPSLHLAAHLKGMRILSSHLWTDHDRWHVSFMFPKHSCVHGCATCKPAVTDFPTGTRRWPPTWCSRRTSSPTSARDGRSRTLRTILSPRSPGSSRSGSGQARRFNVRFPERRFERHEQQDRARTP